MKSPIFTGCGVAIVTPFRNDAVDLDAFGKIIDWQIDSGTDAIVVCGTTGESATMSNAERLRTIAYCVERVNGRVPVIAGSGTNDTAHAVELSRDAQKAGADALLLVTPYYNKATQTGLILHYQRILDAVERPCILYNVPSRTGVSIAPETCAKLAEHPNIHGIKEASGNLSAVQNIFNLCPEDFFVWSGNDDETVPICALGGQGVISVVANVYPSEMRRMTELCKRNDYAAAGKIQVSLKRLCDAMFCEVNPVPVKAAMNLMGLSAGEYRLPMCDPSPANLERIRDVLREYGLLQG
ncbi:MAG: 4-hydroxy-tetrahydrodipicolinate synthase [Oscillospiraceae bacterium]|nr:4-hydroxy-tetrahydrodipicolinate synthase [Oscillospiraceae bacterium]